MPKHQAPVSGYELHKFLLSMGAEIGPLDGRTHLTKVGDLETRIPAAGRKVRVDDHCISRLAREFGLSAGAFREQALGRVPVNAGKVKAQASQPKDDPSSKADVARLAHELAQQATRIERWIRAGARSSALYARVCSDLAFVLKTLEGWPPKVDGELEEATYARFTPDDKGYRPTGTDSLLNGPARATGATARVVKRRRTVTRWEHDQMEGGDAA